MKLRIGRGLGIVLGSFFIGCMVCGAAFFIVMAMEPDDCSEFYDLSSKCKAEIEELVEQGNTAAMYRLALYYESKMNLSEAKRLTRKSAEMGGVEARLSALSSHGPGSYFTEKEAEGYALLLEKSDRSYVLLGVMGYYISRNKSGDLDKAKEIARSKYIKVNDVCYLVTKFVSIQDESAGVIDKVFINGLMDRCLVPEAEKNNIYHRVKALKASAAQ